MAISSRYGSEWRDFFFNHFLFHLYSICCVIMGWRGVGGWVSLNDVLAHSLLFMVSVRPTGPLPASRPAGTAESVVASATQRVKWTLTNNKKKNKKKNSRPIPLLQVLRYFVPFCLRDIISGLIVLFLRKTVVIAKNPAKMTAALLWVQFTCTWERMYDCWALLFSA